MEFYLTHGSGSNNPFYCGFRKFLYQTLGRQTLKLFKDLRIPAAGHDGCTGRTWHGFLGDMRGMGKIDSFGSRMNRSRSVSDLRFEAYYYLQQLKSYKRASSCVIVVESTLLATS